jgi:triphosphoribosyl-dephospho-CoA synthetase
MNLAAELIGELAQIALLHEATLTPKPGLVDAVSCGAHTDMDLALLIRSADALMPFFTRFAARGIEDAPLSINGKLSAIRADGREAEDVMFSATGGVNTHKGALFLLGLLCYAAGYCSANNVSLLPEVVCATAALACRGVTEELGANAGRAYTRYGARGARGEAEEGYPHVLDALATFDNALCHGAGAKEAWLLALLRLISRVEDSNVLARCGEQTARKLRARAEKIVAHTSGGDEKLSYDVIRLDQVCVAWNASPGGSADLLACAMFLRALVEKDE